MCAEVTDVSCMMNNYAGECCLPFKPKGLPGTTTSTTTNLPEQLTRDAITAGLGTISMASCRAKATAKGEVKVSIRVSPEGAVSGVTIKASPDPQLSACVTAAASRGAFAKTQRGGSFFYVWSF